LTTEKARYNIDRLVGTKALRNHNRTKRRLQGVCILVFQVYSTLQANINCQANIECWLKRGTTFYQSSPGILCLRSRLLSKATLRGLPFFPSTLLSQSCPSYICTYSAPCITTHPGQDQNAAAVMGSFLSRCLKRFRLMRFTRGQRELI